MLLGYDGFAPSFSSAGEDMILRHLVGSDRQQGFYVDVGACDPVVGSNTFFFYNYGWRGINIEARPGSKALFDRHRPRDINLETGISSQSNALTYYVVAEGKTMNSFSREFIDHLGLTIQREVSVPTAPLAHIMAKHLPQGQKIDFMSVDVEGMDFEVLASNDWNRYRPEFLVVETEAGSRRSEDLLLQNGYRVCARNSIILDAVEEAFFVDTCI